ncbi:MAG: hypothetical protein AAF957_11805 [Planctomycetota bacterium]
MTSEQGERTDAGSLDGAVHAAADALAGAGIGAPDALLLLATGTRGVGSLLRSRIEVPLHDVPSAPRRWHDVPLLAGELDGSAVWLVEDAPAQDDAAPAWTRAFPVWLAAAAGTPILVHTSAGTALRQDDRDPLGVGTVVRIQDHLNLSGTTPLRGLGESRLGPLFPDQTRLHDAALARIAGDAARETGTELASGVAACAIGPALATPAELAWFARAGADVAVQRLAGPLIAAAHAGLRTLALTAVTDVAGESIEVHELVDRASRTAPALDGLVVAIASRLGAHARALAEETGP